MNDISVRKTNFISWDGIAEIKNRTMKLKKCVFFVTDQSSFCDRHQTRRPFINILFQHGTGEDYEKRPTKPKWIDHRQKPSAIIYTEKKKVMKVGGKENEEEFEEECSSTRKIPFIIESH